MQVEDSLTSYSLNESERIQSIREWSSKPTPDHARDLIRTYWESEWRSTRLEVLRHFGAFRDSRSLQFLIEIATKNEDLAEQRLAILALSQRKTRTAQVFLKQFYIKTSETKGQETLRPSLAYALGQVQDFSAVPLLLKDWDQAYSKQDWPWLRNIVLALGELKAFETLPRLRNLLENAMKGVGGAESSLTLSIFFALARLERDSRWLQNFNLPQTDDPILYQVYQSTLSQIQIRSQFKLEDYLDKIFTSPQPHPVLPLELKAFDSEEVKLGLSVFSIEKDGSRFLFALRGVGSKDRVPYLKMILAQVMAQTEVEAQIQFLVEAAPLLNDVLNDATDDENRAEVLTLFQPLLASNDLNVRLEALSSCFFVGGSSAVGGASLLTGEQALVFLQSSDDGLAIRYLNLWSEWELVQNQKTKKTSELVSKWIEGAKLSPPVYGRLIRACVELGVESNSITKRFVADFKQPALRSSLLLYAERFPEEIVFSEVVAAIHALSKVEQENLGQRILGVFESYAEKKKAGTKILTDAESVLKLFANHYSINFRVGVLRYLRFQPDVAWEPHVIKEASHQNPLVELNAVIALKCYSDSREASDALTVKLESQSAIVRGRALDALCAHRSLLAKRAVIEFLRTHLDQEEVVDKIYRSFLVGAGVEHKGSSEYKGSEEFGKAVAEILSKNPDHPQWEKLVSLRDRLGTQSTETPTVNSAALKEVDEKLSQVIPLFSKLDPATQSALRAAEQPFMQALELQTLPFDRAPTVLEYCKALDLILERHLAQKHLFPKLDGQLHDFQTLWHRVGFGEDYPAAEKVMTLLGLKGKITPENFPLHKARMMCGTFFNGKILQDRFKVFDGLRAWAVIFLIFARKIPLTTGAVGPLLKLPNCTDEKCITIAKRLMVLQDLRNPAAHRQTYADVASVTAVRNEAIELLNTILGLIL